MRNLKAILFLGLIIITTSCSIDDEVCQELEEQYFRSLQLTNGNQAAIDELTRQYEEKKSDKGCN